MALPSCPSVSFYFYIGHPPLLYWLVLIAVFLSVIYIFIYSLLLSIYSIVLYDLFVALICFIHYLLFYLLNTFTVTSQLI